MTSIFDICMHVFVHKLATEQCVCVCVRVCMWSQCEQKLNEWARSATDLQPTCLAFGKLKIWFSLCYKSIVILVNHEPLGTTTHASHLEITK